MNLDQLPITAFALEAVVAAGDGRTLTVPRPLPVILRAPSEHEPMSGVAGIGAAHAMHACWSAGVVAADRSSLTITF